LIRAARQLLGSCLMLLFFPAAGVAQAEEAPVAGTLSNIPAADGIERAARVDQPASTPATLPPAGGDETAQPAAPPQEPTGLAPEGNLFKPLLADPRWSRFSAAYHRYNRGDFVGRDIASVSFGETIPLYRGTFGLVPQPAGRSEVGIQAGVFSDFNLDAPSSDLINTDFIVSLYASARAGNFSAFGRLFHQSSHLGDEFLLQTLLERVNVSYEGVDLKLSYELPLGVRLYGGGGGLLHREPDSLKTWSAHYGIEFRSPWRVAFAAMRPVLGADFKNFEQNNWRTDISARAGFQFDNMRITGRNVQLLAEYFNGYSPSGQFYIDKIEYFGVGLHFHF